MRNFKNNLLKKILQKKFCKILRYFCGNYENCMWKFWGRYVILLGKFYRNFEKCLRKVCNFLSKFSWNFKENLWSTYYSHKFCQSIHTVRNCRLHKIVTLQNESTNPYHTSTQVSGSTSQLFVQGINMKFGNREKRIAIIALHIYGSHPKEICKLLKELPVTEWFVYCILVSYRETDDVEDRQQSGHPYCV